ncbi:hypothetical protein thalar_00711 [Litoreibacter arenae DSM 19593]|uniref:Uncharacterized protein n=1 Tax=Litoreibacter arenae DSM 19593 TaxID=1123360 RepID=S9QIG9_9RHOB|nr:hypothetical protein thalar_00711 [Litoreibacter arenae DSM 19593]
MHARPPIKPSSGFVCFSLCPSGRVRPLELNLKYGSGFHVTTHSL